MTRTRVREQAYDAICLYGESLSMSITCYADLITAANAQAEPQRLLFVFARAELPDDATAIQKQGFAAGHGGALAPVVCVDKLPAEQPSFAGLVEESAKTGFDWDIVFVTTMSGRAGIAPSSDEAAQALKMMVESVRQGGIASFLAFDRAGIAVGLS